MKRVKIVAATILAAICVFAVCLFAGCKIDYAATYNDDAKIISSNGYTSMSLSEKSASGKYTCSCSEFSGVIKAVSDFNVTDDTTANLKLNVEAGDFKLVLTNKDTVYVLKEGSYEGVLTFEEIPEGRYTLKMVGVGAKFELEINY